MGWDDVSLSLFGAVDDGRLMEWVTGVTVKPYLDELQHHIPFGEPDGRRGADRSTIIRLCVESDNAKDGKYTRDRPPNYTVFIRAERYARAVGLIVRENSYDGCILNKPTLTYSKKCEIVLSMISLVRQESSKARRGRFNPERDQGETAEAKSSRTLLPSIEVLNKERSQIILNEQILLLHPSGIHRKTTHKQLQMWVSLPADEGKFRELIKLHEGYLSVIEKRIVANLDIAGAASIDKDLGPRTRAYILDNLQGDSLVEEYKSIKSESIIYGVLRASNQRELDTMQRAHEYFGIHANKGEHIGCSDIPL
jgi:hypothetical protein